MTGLALPWRRPLWVPGIVRAHPGLIRPQPCQRRAAGQFVSGQGLQFEENYYPRAVAAAGGGSVTLDFAGYTQAGIQSSPYTFSGHAIGVAATGRRVLFACCVSNASEPVSATVAGGATTRVLTATDSAARSLAWFVTDADVDAGTTADIAVTMGGTRDVEIAVFRLIGAATPTTPTTATDATLALSVDITVLANGACCAAAIDDAAGADFAWTGLTERQEGTSTNYDSSYASDMFAAAQSPLTVSVANPATTGCLGACAWGPA